MSLRHAAEVIAILIVLLWHLGGFQDGVDRSLIGNRLDHEVVAMDHLRATAAWRPDAYTLLLRPSDHGDLAGDADRWHHVERSLFEEIQVGDELQKEYDDEVVTISFRQRLQLSRSPGASGTVWLWAILVVVAWAVALRLGRRIGDCEAQPRARSPER